jgi:predicted Zn-ribbon and HTH transcriptional regulator
LIPVRSIRPDVHEDFASAIERLLSLEPDDRPQTVAELRALLSRHAEEREESDRVRELDAKRRRLKRFRYDPMQCPACGDVLSVPEPLAPGTCPVCQDGKIKRRRIEEKACPSCGAGVLRRLDNTGPVLFCPTCSIGRMAPKRRFLRETSSWRCEACEFELERSATGAVDGAGNDRTWDEWRTQSGRQLGVLFCEACLAQFDEMPDGRWQRMTPNVLGQEWTRLYPDEWARVAAGLAPDSGNACCESCAADYFIADGCVTLLSDPLSDPHGFATHYCGHLVPINELPFLAVGKESGHKGLVCKGCRLEFDSQGHELKLVRSADPRLRRHAGESHRLKDWHRIAQFGEGEIGFDAKNPDLVWRGMASELHGEHLTGRPQRLVIDDGSILFGGFFRRQSELLRDVVRIDNEGDVVTLRLIDGSQWSLKVEPVKLTFRLESGKDEVELRADALARRLSAVAKRRRG